MNYMAIKALLLGLYDLTYIEINEYTFKYVVTNGFELKG